MWELCDNGVEVVGRWEEEDGFGGKKGRHWEEGVVARFEGLEGGGNWVDRLLEDGVVAAAFAPGAEGVVGGYHEVGVLVYQCLFCRLLASYYLPAGAGDAYQYHSPSRQT